MYYYFSEVDLKKYNPSYEIEKIVDYEIELNETIYKVWVFFKNIDNITDSFYIEFFIDDNNHLKILTPPQKSEKVFKFNKDSEEGKKIMQILKSATVDKTGVSRFSTEELEKILKQIGKKQNSTYLRQNPSQIILPVKGKEMKKSHSEKSCTFASQS